MYYPTTREEAIRLNLETIVRNIRYTSDPAEIMEEAVKLIQKIHPEYFKDEYKDEAGRDRAFDVIIEIVRQEFFGNESKEKQVAGQTDDPLNNILRVFL